jgi:hypothetical protein
MGTNFAVNQVMNVEFSGFMAALFWRATYLYKLGSPQSRARIAADWLLDLLFFDPRPSPRSEAASNSSGLPGTRSVKYVVSIPSSVLWLRTLTPCSPQCLQRIVAGGWVYKNVAYDPWRTGRMR